MSSLLTSRFLAYRRAPKPVAVPPPAPKRYEVEGFISPEEKVIERQGRLTEAIARGEILSAENNRFFKMHRRLRNAIGNFQIAASDRQSRQVDDRIFRHIMRTTQRVCSGGGF